MGAIAAVICSVMRVNLITGITIGLLTYMIADRILKQLFIGKVEKPMIVTKTGIGIYIITWIFLWILLYTMLKPPA